MFCFAVSPRERDASYTERFCTTQEVAVSVVNNRDGRFCPVLICVWLAAVLKVS